MGKEDIKKHQIKKGEVKNPKGRPKKLVSLTLDKLKAEGYEQVTKTQVIDAYTFLMGLDENRLENIKDDKNEPMLLRIVSKSILDEDAGFEIIERLIDRAHGKPAQTNNNNTKVEIVEMPEWYKDI